MPVVLGAAFNQFFYSYFPHLLQRLLTDQRQSLFKYRQKKINGHLKLFVALLYFFSHECYLYLHIVSNFTFLSLFFFFFIKMDSKDWIDVNTEKNHYSLDHFVIPSHYEKDVSSILIPHGVIMVNYYWQRKTFYLFTMVFYRTEFKN